MPDRVQNPDYLRARQYRTPDNLRAREELYRHLSPPVDLFSKALSLLDLRGREAVLDLGCGDGLALAHLRDRGHAGLAVGLDISAGMLRGAAGYAAPLVQADAQTLPFRDGSFEKVLALYMAYHLPDRRRAFREWDRVLSPGGALVVATSYIHTQPKGYAFRDAIAAALGRPPPERFTASFNMENGGRQLENFFTIVGSHRYRGELVLRDPQAYLESFESTKEFFNPPSEEAWWEQMRWLRQQLVAEIKRNGSFRDEVNEGFFLCAKRAEP